MDTKSRNFKYSYLLKGIALILVFALSFLAARSAFLLLRSEAIFADNGKEDFTSTPSFLYNVARDLNTISRFVTFDSELLSDLNTFTERDETTKEAIKRLNGRRYAALELYNIIIDFKALAPETENDEVSQYDEISEFAEDSNYDNSDSSSAAEVYNYTEAERYLNDIDFIEYADDIESARAYLNKDYSDSSYAEWYTDYQQIRALLFQYVNNATNSATINSEFDDKITNLATENWLNYKDYRNMYFDMIAAMKNLKFAVVNKATGELCTNIEDENFNINTFKSQLQSGIFHIDYSAKDGLIDGGIPMSTGATNAVLEFFSLVLDSPTPETLNNDTLKSLFGDEYDAYIYIGSELEEGDVYYYIYENYQEIKSQNIPRLSLTVILLVLAIIPFVYLILVSGGKEDGSLRIAKIDRLPFLLHLILSGALIAGLSTIDICLLVLEFNNSYFDEGIYSLLGAVFMGIPTIFGVIFGFVCLILTELVLSTARLVKNDAFIKNTLFYHSCVIIKKLFLLIFTPFSSTLRRRYIFGVIVYFIINIILALSIGASYQSSALIPTVLLLAFNVAAFIFVGKYLTALNKVAGVAHEMRNGNFDVPLEIQSLPKPLRPLAEDIIESRSSIQIAVNNAMKGERMKTELITNVSHDLKTPLTSIINYVDLLKKCNLTDEDALKYLEVLDEKSIRLKRLIEDLTEASKASTGNIKMTPVPVDLYELALQALGEHDDVLEAAGLKAVINTPVKHPIVFADSQYTWRTIDNLFSNAKKYAQYGTRVYIDVYSENGYGVFSMKNVSKNELNIPAQELTERFVRGDSSRTGEGGSGLGLSIAQSLCEHQNGKFVIDIDGDLFKATIMLPEFTGDIPE